MSEFLDYCPPELRSKAWAPLEAVKAAFQTIEEIYGQSHEIPPLLPRSELMLVCHAVSAAVFREHAKWSHTMKTSDRGVDLEVFVRWMNEGGISSSFREVLEISTRHSGARISMSSTLACGHKLQHVIGLNM